MMRVSTLAQNTLVKQNVLRLQSEMVRAQNQLSTGKEAQTNGGLGRDASQSLSLRNDLNRIEQSSKTIAVAETRMQVMQASFDRIHQNTQELSLDAITGAFENAARLPTLQVTSDAMLQETIGLMNRSLSGRFLFAGTKTDAPPVEDMATILDGDPVTGRYGFNQQIANRALADQVNDAAAPGGLTVTTDATTGSLTLSDTRKDGFGFSIERIVSDSPVGITTTETANSEVVTVGGLGALGDDGTVTIVLGLPDGETVELTVDDRGSRPTRLENLAANISAALAGVATADLTAASVMRAGADFFDTTPPQIVRFNTSGQPELVEDNPANPQAIWWYGGSIGDDPRGDVAAEVDDGTTIRYGVRADEPAIADTVKHLAILTVVDHQTADPDMYRALSDKAGRGLQSAMGQTEHLINEVGAIEEITVSIRERNESVRFLAETQLGSIEDIDPYEVSTRLLSYETQLQATYQITGRLQSLSLVNVLRF